VVGTIAARPPAAGIKGEAAAEMEKNLNEQTEGIENYRAESISCYVGSVIRKMGLP
jgi:hypothetical protein